VHQRGVARRLVRNAIFDLPRNRTADADAGQNDERADQ
jgi:hypothetical protein